jgi:glutaconate CoA-transferase subunit B
MLKATPRSCVARLDFRTSAGYLEGGNARAESGARGGGPRAVITDFGILTPQPPTNELALTALHPGATVEEARAAVGWPLVVAECVETLAAPTAGELGALRDLHQRTRESHARAVTLPVS